VSLLQGSEPVSEPLALWREVLESAGRQDALGFLRRRCPTPQPAEDLFAALTAERDELFSHMGALELPEAQARVVMNDLSAFFVRVQVEACRWSLTQHDHVTIWPWAEDPAAAHQPAPSRHSVAILQDTSRAILSELDLRRLLPLLVDRARALTHADVAFLALWNPESQAIDISESRGLDGLVHHQVRLSEPERRRLLEGEDARFLPIELLPSLAELLGRYGLTELLAAPLRYQQATLGVLCCATMNEERGIASGELLTLLASQTAIAIRNAAHYREVVQKAAALHAANDQLRGLDRMKDEFLATVSHELRTPLNFITGFGSILLDEQEGGLTEEQRYFVKNMMDGAFQLLALVNDLLDYSRIRSGKLPLNYGPCDMNKLLGEAFELFRFQVAELNLSLSLDVPSALPTVRGDAQRLSQVINNMLTNALKFTPNGGRVRVSARLEGDRLTVEVADTGVGIRSDQIPLLFNRFSQLETGHTRQTGTGLGLAICKSLVEAHGGDIGVYSPAKLEPGKGSAFWFTLPVETP
jgi:signal transduction histidine kinase